MTPGYGYFWFRHRSDGSTFICVRDAEDGLFYMPALTQGFSLAAVEQHATLLGPVPRSVVGGGSVDQ